MIWMCWICKVINDLKSGNSSSLTNTPSSSNGSVRKNSPPSSHPHSRGRQQRQYQRQSSSHLPNQGQNGVSNRVRSASASVVERHSHPLSHQCTETCQKSQQQRLSPEVNKFSSGQAQNPEPEASNSDRTAPVRPHSQRRGSEQLSSGSRRINRVSRTYSDQPVNLKQTGLEQQSIRRPKNLSLRRQVVTKSVLVTFPPEEGESRSRSVVQYEKVMNLN